MKIKSTIRTLPFYRAAAVVYARVRTLPAFSWVVRPTAFQMGEQYDWELTQLMRRVLEPDSLCVDVGANMGKITAAMFEAAPRAHHFAFEPIPSLASDLSKRFPLARIHNCALSDQPSVSEFYYCADATGESGLRRTAAHHRDPRVETIQVEVKRLDDVIPPTERVALIKIDAEGAEIPIIRGGRGTIRRCRPLIVFESGSNTTPMFGVTADDIYDTITIDLHMCISTMRHWLKGRPPFTRQQFHEVSHIDGEPFHGRPFFDFYFVVY